MNDSFSEKTIEDIFVSNKAILAEILQAGYADLNFIARQKIVSSGKLDLLYLYQEEIFLIELKVVPFYPDIIRQIAGYETNLLHLQKQGRLIQAPIQKIILVTGAKEADYSHCAGHNIRLIVYRPELVMAKYYEHFKELSYFLKIQPGDYGVVRIGLILPTLNHLAGGKTLEEMSRLENRSEKTIRNKISVAQLLGLVGKFQQTLYLTELGSKLISAGRQELDDRLSAEQAEILAAFLKKIHSILPLHTPLFLW